MSLARLLEQATPGPWVISANALWFWGDKQHRDLPMERFEAQSAAVALAPEMARLLIDIIADDGTVLRPSLLARYLELDGRTGEA